MEDLPEIKTDEYIPASMAKRIIAFGMDSVLLFILIQLLTIAIPNLYNENSQKEFNKLIHQVSLLEVMSDLILRKWPLL